MPQLRLETAAMCGEGFPQALSGIAGGEKAACASPVPEELACGFLSRRRPFIWPGTLHRDGEVAGKGHSELVWGERTVAGRILGFQR